MNAAIGGVVDDTLKRAAPLRDLYRHFNQPRSDLQLSAFVVGQHDTPMRQMHQCLLEISIKDRALRRGQISRRQMLRRMESSEGDDLELIEIDIEEHDEAMLGAARELRTLISIWESFGVEFTHEKWMAEEMDYWRKRLVRQARHEINQCGSIGVGNQDALEQIGISPGPLLAEARACLQSQGSSISPPLLHDTPPADSKT